MLHLIATRNLRLFNELLEHKFKSIARLKVLYICGIFTKYVLSENFISLIS